MKYLIEEYWFDDDPTGKEIKTVIEDNFLNTYQLYEIVTQPKPQPWGGMHMGPPGEWTILRFRKKE